jgi:hypothetical protein
MIELMEKEEEEGTMPPDKALFESQDTHPATFDAEEPGEKKYMGPERRRDNRRKAVDRRVDVRFEVKATDRREKEGRRQDDVSVKFW